MASNTERHRPSEPPASELLDLDVDLRLGTNFWIEAWEVDRSDAALLSALFRFAYGRGYHDALTEPRRGQLCRDHGLTVPTRGFEGRTVPTRGFEGRTG